MMACIVFLGYQSVPGGVVIIMVFRPQVFDSMVHRLPGPTFFEVENAQYTQSNSVVDYNVGPFQSLPEQTGYDFSFSPP